MIKLTRLNGQSLVVNVDLIRYVEQTPDTIITLTGNEKIVVQESPEEVIRRAIQYGRSLRVWPQ